MSSVPNSVTQVDSYRGIATMGTTPQSAHRKELDTKKRSSTSRHFEDALRQKIVGQDERFRRTTRMTRQDAGLV